VAEDVQRKIDAYLGSLRACLRGLDEPTIRDIVDELRGHIVERASSRGEMTVASVEAALAALGPAEALAGEYVTTDALARAEVSRSPLQVLRGLFRWASLSAFGFLVLILTASGYSVSLLLFLSALCKPLHPQSAGLWTSRDDAGDLVLSLRLGLEGAPGVGRELLGWWIVPVGLVGGLALMVLTTRLALWAARRRSRPERPSA
jgi:hypothetical protein